MNPNPQSGFSDSNFPSISLINRLLSLLLFAILLQTITCRIFAKTNPDQVNQALGIPLFPNDTPASIWESPPESLAEKLSLPPESKTTYSSSFRSYEPKKILDRTAYSAAIHAENERPTSINFVFANKGDIEIMFSNRQPPKNPAAQVAFARKIDRDYKRFILEDSSYIQKKLTELFGQPRYIRIGDSPKSSENARLWTWQNNAFLLTAPREEYVMLRILPAQMLDSKGIERIPRTDIARLIASRVQHRPNGDIIITDIPMVNQGPKGFCAPATAERFLRYMAIPADLYVLSMAANTELGGGTALDNLIGGIHLLVQRYGRKIQRDNKPTSIKNISPYVDKGIPVLWGMLSDDQFNSFTDEYTKERSQVADWQLWKENMPKWVQKFAASYQPDPTSAHVCLIIGYNPLTEEIATSDSWGPEFAERWIPEKVASLVSLNNHLAILP